MINIQPTMGLLFFGVVGEAKYSVLCESARTRNEGVIGLNSGDETRA